MSAIFISHSSKDNVLAKAMERRLRQRHHHSVFLDLDPEKGIVGGQSWERTLYRKLRACRALIALCTNDYLRSHWCFAEIALARMEGKPVIAMLADPLDDGAPLPGILTERQLIDLRKNEDEGFARLWRALDQLDLRGVASDWNPKEPPYLGLNAYQEEHAAVFFGREEESLAGLELLDRGAPGLIIVLGASGSGKSSLVRAGMLPRLRAREDWLILDPFRPGRDPWSELTESLVHAYGRYAKAHLDESGRREQIRERIRAGWRATVRADSSRVIEADAPTPAHDAPDDGVRRLIDLLEQIHDDPPPSLTDRLRNYLEWSLDDLRRLCGPPGVAAASSGPTLDTTPLLDAAYDLRRLSQRRSARVLLVIDQFEELLGPEQVDEGARGFLELLRASVEAEHTPLTVLCTMRSDFLGLFQRHPVLQGVDFESLSLGPMRIDGMRRVIEMPARLAAIEMEEGLADRLLSDTETPDALPLLSFTLWVMCRDRRDDERLEVSAYERLGGLQGTIAREADAVLASAARDQKQDDLRRALLQMARLSEDGSYARRPVDWDSPEVLRVEPHLAKLVDRRVLVSRMEGDRRVIEVAHEALFRTWAPLKAWLENARSELLLKQQIERDAVTWRDNGRPPDTLWRGGRLLQARDLIDRAEHRRPEGEMDVSREFVRAGMRRRTRQRATLVTAGTGILAVLTGFLGFALVQARRAREEQGRTLDLARVAIAGEWLQTEPTSGALVLLEVADPENTRFAPRRLSEALSRGFAAAVYRHTGPVHSVAMSPDGSRVLTTSAKLAIVWEARTGRLLHTLQHDDGVISAAFDATGRWVVTRSGEVGEQHSWDRVGNSAHVWEVDTGTSRFAITHADAVNGAVFSPNGQLLLTTSDDDTAQLWEVEAGRLRFSLKHDADVDGAAFTPDGDLLVTVSGDAAHVWTPDSDQPVVMLTQEGSVVSASFSPDGAFLATAGYQGIRSWHVGSWTEGHSFAHDFAQRVAFTPNGRYLLSASSDDVRVWDFETGSPMFKEPIFHRNLVFAGFSHGGSLVITASGHHDRRGYGSPQADNAVRYGDARTGENRFVNELRFGSEVMMVAFGPSNRSVLINSAQRVQGGRAETLREDATARLWDVDLGDKRLQWAHEHEAYVSAASFSLDGRRVLTVSGNAARLWDAETGKPLVALDHDKDIVVAAFTPDGDGIVTASRDGTARVWDVGTGQQRFAAMHEDDVQDALLVANGGLLATMSHGKARLWTLTKGTAAVGTQVFEMPDDVDPIRRDSWGDNFSPNGTLAVARSGETAQLWDVAAGRARFTLKHGGFVRLAAFVADGRLLVTGGDEKVARVWDTTTGQPKYTFEHSSQLEAIAVAPDGLTVLTVESDGAAHLWNASTGTERFTLQHACGERFAQFIGGGRLAVTQSRGEGNGCESKVMVWDVATGVARSSVSTAAESIGFSENGKVMFAIEDGTAPAEQAAVRLWDVDTGEERFADPFRSREQVRVAALSADGARLVTAAGTLASTWGVGGGLLQSALAAATTVCLTPEFRRQNLGESDAEALRGYETCESKHGRK